MNQHLSGEEADKLFSQLNVASPDRVLRALDYLVKAREAASPAVFFDYDSNHNHAWYLIGLAYEKQGRFAMAADAFHYAAKIYPSDASAYLAFSNVEDDLRRQVTVLEQALDTIEDWELRFNLANAYMDLGDPASALRHLEKIDPALADDTEVNESKRIARAAVKASGRQ